MKSRPLSGIPVAERSVVGDASNFPRERPLLFLNSSAASILLAAPIRKGRSSSLGEVGLTITLSEWTGPSLRKLKRAEQLLLTLSNRRFLGVTSISVGLTTGESRSSVGETGSLEVEVVGVSA